MQNDYLQTWMDNKEEKKALNTVCHRKRSISNTS